MHNNTTAATLVILLSIILTITYIYLGSTPPNTPPTSETPPTIPNTPPAPKCIIRWELLTSLGLNSSATLADVKTAIRKEILRLHPDRIGRPLTPEERKRYTLLVDLLDLFRSNPEAYNDYLKTGCFIQNNKRVCECPE